MTASCQGGYTCVAATGNERSLFENWEMFEGNYEDCGEGHGSVSNALLSPQSNADGHNRAEENRKEFPLRDEDEGPDLSHEEQSSRSGERSGNKRHDRTILSRLLELHTPANCALVMTYVVMPLMALVLLKKMPPRRCPLPPLTGLMVPAYTAILVLADACTDVIMYLTTVFMRMANIGAPFGVFLHTKLLLRVLLLVCSQREAAHLASAVEVIWDRYVTAAALDVVESCSDFRVCLPRTLPDLYGPETCASQAPYQSASGRSTRDILRSCARVYGILSDGYDESIPMHQRYGPHMENLPHDNALVACVWIFALGSKLLAVVAFLKMAVDAVIDLIYFYIQYRKELGTGAASWIEAFQRAANQSLWSTYHPLLDPAFIWLHRLMSSKQKNAAAVDPGQPGHGE